MLIVGMVDPNSMQITISRGLNTGIDLTTMASCKLYVRKPNTSSDVIWTPSSESSTASTYTATYKFQSGDLDREGCYIVKPRLFDATGTKIRFCSHIGVQVYSV